MSFIRTLTHRADTIISEDQTTPRNTDRDRVKAHMTLPYIGGATEPISRLIRKTGVAAHANPHTTRILVAPKDKDNPQDKCGMVYQLTCHDCNTNNNNTVYLLHAISPKKEHVACYKHMVTNYVQKYGYRKH